MSLVTPVKAPAATDLQNALQLAVIYGDKDIADSDAKQALDRIRGLIAQALAKLAEPNEAAILVAKSILRSGMGEAAFRLLTEPDRQARDTAALILYAALTGEAGGEQWAKYLPCPSCDGSGTVAGGVCESCKGTGIPL